MAKNAQVTAVHYGVQSHVLNTHCLKDLLSVLGLLVLVFGNDAGVRDDQGKGLGAFLSEGTGARVPKINVSWMEAQVSSGTPSFQVDAGKTRPGRAWPCSLISCSDFH